MVVEGNITHARIDQAELHAEHATSDGRIRIERTRARTHILFCV